MIMMKRMPMIMMMNPMRQLHTQACDSLEVFCKQRIASTHRAIERVRIHNPQFLIFMNLTSEQLHNIKEFVGVSDNRI